MENPHEKQQAALLSRIVTKLTTLNTTVTDLNERMETLKRETDDVAALGHMWISFMGSTEIHLENANTQPRSP